MIVYVDSNFVLELVLGQSEHQAADGIIALAEEGRIDLSVPAFALFEVEQRLKRRGAIRQSMIVMLRKQAETMSETHPEMAEELRASAQMLTGTFLTEESRLRKRRDDVSTRLIAASHVIPMDRYVVEQALTPAAEWGLHIQDALIVCSILSAAHQGEPSVLVTRDADINRDPLVEQELAREGCQIIGSISGALEYLRQHA